MKKTLIVAATGIIAASALAAPAQAGVRAVDGDTVEIGNVTVRMLGIDTPEVGTCGSDAATRVTAKFLQRKGLRVVGTSGKDKYGRTLAYVRAGKTDLGTLLIRKGLADARYDSRDGYGAHPLENRYRTLDSRTKDKCGRDDNDKRKGSKHKGHKKGNKKAGGYANCSVAPGPVYRGKPGYAPHLDGDGDGVGCES